MGKAANTLEKLLHSLRTYSPDPYLARLADKIEAACTEQVVEAIEELMRGD